MREFRRPDSLKPRRKAANRRVAYTPDCNPPGVKPLFPRPLVSMCVHPWPFFSPYPFPDATRFSPHPRRVRSSGFNRFPLLCAAPRPLRPLRFHLPTQMEPNHSGRLSSYCSSKISLTRLDSSLAPLCSSAFIRGRYSPPPPRDALASAAKHLTSTPSKRYATPCFTVGV